MSKTLITALGLVVSLGVIALGFFLVALPIYLQSVGVDAQTATVSNLNTVYQAQVDTLREQEDNIDAINASVEGLRDEIPAAAQLDDVFEVIGRAAEASGVTIESISAGTQAPFTARTSVDAGGEPAVVAEPEPEPTPTDGSDGSVAEPTAPDPSAATGRQQVDFAILVTATDMGQATAFLDALRAGPRLLSGVTAAAVQSGEGTISLQVSALTYLDSEG